MSRRTAIKRLDSLSESDADAELAEIEQDEAEAGMGAVPINEPESVTAV